MGIPDQFPRYMPSPVPAAAGPPGLTVRATAAGDLGGRGGCEELAGAARVNHPPARPASHPGNDGEPHVAGMEPAALADQARALAPRALAALAATGYPGMQVVMLTTHSPFTAQVKQWQVAAWEIGRLAVPRECRGGGGGLLAAGRR
jgi:hypothetical protein